jgi:hypothetical protein
MKAKRKHTKIPLEIRRLKRGGSRVMLEDVERRVAARSERKIRTAAPRR